MTTMQPSNSCQAASVVYHPRLAICDTGDTRETTLIDGRFSKGTLRLLRRVNHKENNEADRLLTPENGCGHHFTEINYLFLF
ncbi:neuronal regeneration-related protein-like [Leptodactylus fuscus]|uniref:neuronal regeneration-related protein-like n=1 Tax=Leptodactylus fuscus TaxID=238119 RepID=UPI003F4EA2D6